MPATTTHRGNGNNNVNVNDIIDQIGPKVLRDALKASDKAKGKSKRSKAVKREMEELSEALSLYEQRATVRSARERAERPRALGMMIAEEGRMSFHVSGWRLAATAAGVALLVVTTVGLVKLALVGGSWVAKRLAVG